MKILVTGANGYLGSGIVKQLLDDGCDVIATDKADDHIDNRAKIIVGDIFSLANPYHDLCEPDIVLHLAWRDGFVHNSDLHITDLPGHYYFLKSLITSGVKHVAVMGSMHEIGFYEGSVDEYTPCHPLNLYGIAKNSLRDTVILLCNQYNILFQWLRGYYIVSNNPFGSSIFSKIVCAEREGKEMFPFSFGQNQYDFLDYGDFCYQVASTVEQINVNGIINICSGQPEKLADRTERFIIENGFKIKLDYGKFPERPYDSKAIWGNDYKIKEILYNREHNILL